MKPSLLFYPGNLVYSFTCMFYIYKVCFIVSFLQKKSRPDFGICDKRTQKGVAVSKEGPISSITDFYTNFCNSSILWNLIIY